MKLAFDAPLEAMSADERRLLLERRPPEEAGVGEAVAAIVADVRARGDDALLDDASRLLLEQALLIEGVRPEDPIAFAKRLNRVMERALG